MIENRQLTIQAFIFLSILVVAPITLYWPGLGGEFLLDDTSNLQNLAHTGGGIDSADDARAFVFGGVSSTLGRPVSLATFLIDGQDWPAHPESFKYTNILIHTLSTIFLFAALLKLSQLLGKESRQALLFSAMGALLWSIHPLQISTVLYVVQRMTELSALFVFLGLWSYFHGRLKVKTNAGAGYTWMTVAIIICGPLATFSKENGFLLPFLIGVVEFTLLSQVARPKHWKYWAIPLLGIPTFIIIAYLTKSTFNEAPFANRDFTMAERVLTQGRILMDYISSILLPIDTPHLFHDNIAVSKGLFSPFTTFLSAVAVISAIVIAVIFRKKYFVASFAVLWFFAGHILESTVLSLELYYEHRNYLPLAGPAIAAAYYACLLVERFKQPAVIGISILFCVLAATTWNYSATWGDDKKLQATWYKENPDSVRTTIRYAMNEMKEFKFDSAMQATTKMVDLYPEHLTARIFHTTVLCLADKMNEEDYTLLAHMAANSYYDASAFSRFKHLYELVRDRYCVQISQRGMLNLINKFIENPFTSARGNNVLMGYHLMKSEIYSSKKALEPTLKALDNAFEANPSIDIILKKVHILTITRNFDKAEDTLTLARLVDKTRGKLIPSRMDEVRKAQKFIDAGRKATQHQR
ncbi:hypothetical protein ACFL2V_03685 [Pseudomonadota bacterium]